MASDDLVRIVYRPKRMSNAPGAGGLVDESKASKAVVRRNRTSISMDPDLYDTFVLIEGDARSARHTLRKWATEADATRENRSEAVGVSRLVHKQMLAKIRDVVRAGLTVIQKVGSNPAVEGGAPATARAAGGEDDLGAAWDNFAAPAGTAEAKKAIKKAKTTSKKAPGKKEKSIPAAEAIGAGQQCAEVAASAQRSTGLEGLMAEPATAGVAHAGGDEWTREREPSADGPDPFM